MLNDMQQFIMDRVYTDTNSGCWIWSGPIHHRGYPVIKRSGAPKVARKVIFEEFIGQINDDQIKVVNTCGCKLCVNPHHVTLKDFKEYARERAQRSLCKRGHSLDDAYEMNGARKYRLCRICTAMRYRGEI